MTDIKHHLTDELLMAYSAGTLPEAFNLVVATHISMCDDCRAALAELDAVGGEIIAANQPVELSADSLAATMALIESNPIQIEKSAIVDRPADDLPRPLQDYAGQGFNDIRWRPIGGGVSQMILSTSKNATVRLLKIPAGSAVPDHGHNGTELTLVLRGAFSDEVDHFGMGDIEVANEDLTHTPVADEGEDCICLAATDAPLAFKGMVPRIVQKFINI